MTAVMDAPSIEPGDLLILHRDYDPESTCDGGLRLGDLDNRDRMREVNCSRCSLAEMAFTDDLARFRLKVERRIYR